MSEVKEVAKVFVATPMYGGMCTGLYTKSMMHVVGTLPQHGISVAFQFVMNNSLIQSARNQLADIFMETDFTHMLFIDADIEFDAIDIVHMVNADKGVIGGVYPKKKIAWNRIRQAIAAGVSDDELSNWSGDMVISMMDDAESATVKATEPFEVKGVGTGFMLIKREVFERLQTIVDTYKDDDGKDLYEYFALIKNPESGKQMSEDYSFCYLCRHAGIPIYIAPWASFAHVGSYVFRGSPVRMTEKK